MSHLIDTVSELEGHSVGLLSLTEQIDTTTLGGRLIFHVFGALGQVERDLIRERIRAGLKAAEARGRRGGRKPVITVEKLRCARGLIAKGLSVREAAARLQIWQDNTLRGTGPQHCSLPRTPSGPHSSSHASPTCASWGSAQARGSPSVCNSDDGAFSSSPAP